MTPFVEPAGSPGSFAGGGQPVVSGGGRVVAFGGGTGMAALLTGLKTYTSNITAVVTVTDNGGSSGRLRNDFNMAAPGDLRNCLIALADVDPLVAKVFQYRFQEAEFKDHCFGNLFITVVTRIVGDLDASIRAMNRILNVRGRVIPATSSKVSLVAHHTDGTKSTGEVQITKSKKSIERVELRPMPVGLSQEIRDAIRSADLFLFGPGSLFTSVVPNLLIDGIMDEINARGKPRVYIGNIMTQPGETDGFALSHHILALRRHVGNNFPDCVIAHAGKVPPALLEKYAAEGSIPVAQDLGGMKELEGIRVIVRDFLGSGAAARHDSGLLARAIYEEFLEPLARGESSGPLQRGEPVATGSPWK